MTTTVPEPPGVAAQLVPIDRIIPSKTNPRHTFDLAKLAELTESVRRHGVLQPVLVRPKGQGFELVAGERRYRAAKAAGLAEIPASVRDLSDVAVLELQVIENLQREDIHPLEEAQGYRRLLDTKEYTVARIAERIGRSAVYVYDRVKLLQLTKDAQALFMDGKITAGHAVILARLKSADQDRAMNPDDHALFQNENTLFTPGEETDSKDPLEGLKTRSVKELQAWVDQHVRFDMAAEDLPDLFPEAHGTITAAVEAAEKIVPITHNYHVIPEAKDSARTYGPQSWTRADGARGSKTCDLSVTGVIVVGPGRGQAFKVCIEKKKCLVHYGKEIRARKKAEKERVALGSAEPGAAAPKKPAPEKDKWKVQQERDEAERARYKKALPEIRTAILEAVAGASADAKGPLADLLIDSLSQYGGPPKELPPRGTTAEDLVRYLAAIDLMEAARDEWSAMRELPGRLKPLGVDLKKIVDKAAPPPATATKEKVTAKKKAAKK